MIDSKEEFYAFFTAKNSAKPEIHGGFALAHWNGSREVEEQIKNDLKVTIRCIPFDDSPEPGTCVFTGEPSRQRVVWAKSSNTRAARGLRRRIHSPRKHIEAGAPLC